MENKLLAAFRLDRLRKKAMKGAEKIEDVKNKYQKAIDSRPVSEMFTQRQEKKLARIDKRVAGAVNKYTKKAGQFEGEKMNPKMANQYRREQAKIALSNIRPSKTPPKEAEMPKRKFEPRQI